MLTRPANPTGHRITELSRLEKTFRKANQNFKGFQDRAGHMHTENSPAFLALPKQKATFKEECNPELSLKGAPCHPVTLG